MTMRRDVREDLSARLREAAETHRPDRARMLARIERGMAGQERPDHRVTRPPLWSWVRIVSATAAVAGLLAVGGYAVASAVRTDAPAPRAAAAPPAPDGVPAATSRPSASPRPDPGSGGRSGPADPGTSRSPAVSAPASTPSPSVSASAPAAGAEDGPLRSVGSVDPHSNDFWAQSSVTFKTSERLTALSVRLKVRQTGGVGSAGAWRTLPEDDFTLTVGERDGFLVYTWALKAGRTVPVGQWVFAGQYEHDRGGRNAGDDSYTVTATAGGREHVVSGDFAGS
ncbi:hypothetical protein [Streptomyces adustus]